MPDNTSDKNVEMYHYDYIVENNGDISNLEEKAIIYLNELNKKS